MNKINFEIALTEIKKGNFLYTLKLNDCNITTRDKELRSTMTREELLKRINDLIGEIFNETPYTNRIQGAIVIPNIKDMKQKDIGGLSL